MTASDADRAKAAEVSVYDRLLEALCLATPPCQDHRDDAVEAALVVQQLITSERAAAVADLRTRVEAVAEELEIVGWHVDRTTIAARIRADVTGTTGGTQ